MSNENLSRLISSSKICYLPYPYFKIAEIQMHLIFSVYAYYNNVCVCVCVCLIVILLVTHLQKGGSSAVPEVRLHVLLISPH